MFPASIVFYICRANSNLPSVIAQEHGSTQVNPEDNRKKWRDNLWQFFACDWATGKLQANQKTPQDGTGKPGRKRQAKLLFMAYHHCYQRSFSNMVTFVRIQPIYVNFKLTSEVSNLNVHMFIPFQLNTIFR